MARLIEVQDIESLPARLVLTVGDMLWLMASGGRVRQSGVSHSGADDVVQILGPFVQGVIGPDGQIVLPAGPPNVVLFIARQPGHVAIDIMSGDPWHDSRTRTLDISVDS